MKGLIYLLITVVAFGLAAGIVACKPSVPEEPAKEEEVAGEPAREPDYYCDECGAPPEGEGWYLAEGGYDDYKAHMEGHGRGIFCEIEVDKSPPDGERGPCGAAFADDTELTAHKNAEHPDDE